MRIPETGLPKQEVFKRLESFKGKDLDWSSGRMFGYVFDPGAEVRDLAKEAYGLFLSENALDFTVFPSLRRLENDLVAMGAHHLNGDEHVVGNFTSGGTESIILAVKTARDYFRMKKPGISEPEMILPTTAHAAFHKAAHYLDVKVIQVPVQGGTFRADISKIEAAISPRTILLVGSAPSYAHGVIDPIVEIGQLALRHDLLFHVDACIGGFLLPYFRRLGEKVPDFDFSVPGVTSISMDLHKYAYTPKGASLILYRKKDLRKYQIFACSRWIGYSVVNNSIQSTKSGGPMAAAWAVLHFIGEKGYLAIAEKKLKATQLIVKGIEEIKDLRLMVKPDMCLVAFTSDHINVFHIIDEMNSRGWYIQPALSYDNSKENIHLSINASNVAWVDPFLKDLKECVQRAKTLKSEDPLLEIGDGFLKDLSDLDDDVFPQVLKIAGIDGDELPDRMAGINGILNALPPELREKLLIEFVNELFIFK